MTTTDILISEITEAMYTIEEQRRRLGALADVSRAVGSTFVADRLDDFEGLVSRALVELILAKRSLVVASSPKPSEPPAT